MQTLTYTSLIRILPFAFSNIKISGARVLKPDNDTFVVLKSNNCNKLRKFTFWKFRLVPYRYFFTATPQIFAIKAPILMSYMSYVLEDRNGSLLYKANPFIWCHNDVLMSSDWQKQISSRFFAEHVLILIKSKEICDVIKQNESELAITDFKI